MWREGNAFALLVGMQIGAAIVESSIEIPQELKVDMRARFGSTYTKIGTIQRRLAWPLRKDDTQIREAFHILHPCPCGRSHTLAPFDYLRKNVNQSTM